MPVHSISKVVGYIKHNLESDTLLGDLWVRGEVSNLSHSAAGHFYFTLKDSISQMRCVMFRPAHGAENLLSGVAILAHGRVSLYEVRGDLQLYVDLVQPEGVGERQLELERLKVKLDGEGLFEASRKRPLPVFPRRIGVITSPFGSVWHDIRNIIERRFPAVELLLASTLVQGGGASNGIVESFEVMNWEEGVDVVILARGGGSVEELWPFNEESVARSIYSSKSPVVSAVGHETDFTIADMVADCRAPTPSAAAELVVPDRKELHERILNQCRNLIRETYSKLADGRQELYNVMWQMQRQAPEVSSWRQRVDDLTHDYSRAIKPQLEMQFERVKAMSFRLSSLSPSGVLGRGYAIVEREGKGGLVTSAQQVYPGDELQVNLKDGAFPVKALANRKVQ